jgi:peptidoglycan/xylan/chitin deacetylase (PgdA/CDA1 family)
MKMSFIGLFKIMAGILFLWFGVPHLLKLLQIASLRKLCQSSKVIVLTYDDGPGNVLTPTLLKLLASNNVHANFFMIGNKVESFSSQVLDVVAQGHVIGSHSFRHLHAWKYSPVKIIRDIRAGFQLCKNKSFSNWFRPPFGKITLVTLVYTWITHHKLAWWTIDSTDTWANPLAIEKIIERVKKRGGGVILMHDNDRSDVSRHDYVISLTLELIQFARKEGYTIRTLQDEIF